MTKIFLSKFIYGLYSFYINTRNIRLSTCYLFVVYLSTLLITSGYIAAKCWTASGDEFEKWNEMRLWSNKRSYAGVNLKRLRRPQNSFYKLVGFPVEMEESTSWLQAKSCITSVILLCSYVPVSVLAKTSWEFKFLQTSVGTEFIKLGRDLYWIDILWSLWFIVLQLFGFTSQHSALLLNSSIEVQSYKSKHISRIVSFFSAISVDFVNKRCFSEGF